MKDHKILIALAVILVVTLYFSDFTNISGSAVVSKCNDGIDNDGDDYIDSLDMGCADGIGGERTRCQDGKDNDNDGKIDLADPHCIDVQDDNEKGGKCEDGIDNDGDDYIDFPQDKGCSDMNDGETSRCQDDVDNDRDGFTDLADSGCQNIQDDNERCEADTECNIDCISSETATCSTEGDCYCKSIKLIVLNNICETVEVSAGPSGSVASCSPGYTIMSGGWAGTIGKYGIPKNNGFYCEDSSPSSKCYAVCCDASKIDSIVVSETGRLDYGIKTYCPSGYEVVGGGFEDVLVGNGLAPNTLTPGGDQDSLSPLNNNGWYCDDDASNVQGSSCYAVCAKSKIEDYELDCTVEVKEESIVSGLYPDDITRVSIECLSDYFLTGGGFVDRSDSNDDQDYSKPVGNSWFVQEDFNDKEAVPGIGYASCCKLDLIEDPPVCGNGEINNKEICDTNELNGLECSDFDEFEEGDLKCNNNCHLDTSDCIPFDPDPNSYCDDGVINPGEECDPGDPNLNGFTCRDFGFPSEDFLGCQTSDKSDACFFDISNCESYEPGPICGNNRKESGEQCDGIDLNDRTCETLGGYDSGLLSCDFDCKYDRFDCLSTISEGECSWSCNPLLPSICPDSQQQTKTCTFIGQTYSDDCLTLIQEDCSVSYIDPTATVTCSCIQETEIPIFTFFNIILTVLLLTSYYFFKRIKIS